MRNEETLRQMIEYYEGLAVKWDSQGHRAKGEMFAEMADKLRKKLGEERHQDNRERPGGVGSEPTERGEE